ncbi:hypothetical protein ABZY58_11410 [Micromonospora tulbaghiae]|uniref:hypothetical protein n=1 Tax=Micromonospora tulbaghiae TaxID=479978 RepID=UPI0033B0C508
MPSPKTYELRVFRGQQPVRAANRLRVALDPTDAQGTEDVLRRHLYAVAEREGVNRRDAHLFHLDVHEVRGDHVDGRAAFQFSVPVQV